MDESSAAFVDTDVIALAAVDAKKHQITGPKAVQRNRLRKSPLRRRRPWDGQSHVAMYVLNQSAAIETPPVRAPIAIGNAQLASGSVQQLLAGRRDRRRRWFGRERTIRLIARRRTTRERQSSQNDYQDGAIHEFLHRSGQLLNNHRRIYLFFIQF